jgi:hypothetical protein
MTIFYTAVSDLERVSSEYTSKKVHHLYCSLFRLGFGTVPKQVLCPNTCCAQTGTVSKQVLCLNKYCAQTSTVPKQVLCLNRSCAQTGTTGLQFRRFIHSFESEMLYLIVWHIDGCFNCRVGWGGLKENLEGCSLQQSHRQLF